MSSILIIGTYRQTLTVIRSVVRAGHKVVLGLGADTAACEYSRYVGKTWRHPGIESDSAQFIRELHQYLLTHPEIDSVFPIGENELRLFSNEYDSLPPNTQLLMCDPATVNLCLDKAAMSKIVDELDIPQARYATVSDSEALFVASDSIGYPCVVRPTNSKFLLSNSKAVLFHSATDIRRNLSIWPAKIRSLIVQKYVPGQRRNVYFFAIDGHIKALAEVAILRTDQLDGTGLAVSGMTVKITPDLVRYCREIAMRLNYQGAGCAQFLIDPSSGTISFLEINPRLGANFAVVYRAGLDLPVMQLSLNQNNQRLADSSGLTCQEGIHYAWTTGDLLGLKNAIINTEAGLGGTFGWLSAMFKSNLTSSVHITWDWRDPLPTLVLLSRSFFSFVVHLTQERSHQ